MTCAHPKCQPNPAPATHHTRRGLLLCDHHAETWNRYRAARPLAQMRLDYQETSAP